MKSLAPLVFFMGFLAGCQPRHHVTFQAETVTLHLWLPEAASVQFASSIDSYTLHQAKRDRDGSWSVGSLPNQEFQYFYLVDGKPFIPDCRFRQSDDFGAMNCRHLPAMAQVEAVR